MMNFLSLGLAALSGITGVSNPNSNEFEYGAFYA